MTKAPVANVDTNVPSETIAANIGTDTHNDRSRPPTARWATIGWGRRCRNAGNGMALSLALLTSNGKTFTDSASLGLVCQVEDGQQGRMQFPVGSSGITFRRASFPRSIGCRLLANVRVGIKKGGRIRAIGWLQIKCVHWECLTNRDPITSAQFTHANSD